MAKKLTYYLKNFLGNPLIRLAYLSEMGWYRGMSDEKFLCKKYRLSMNKPLNLTSPETYNEKLQWLKLHDRKDIYTRMVDKYEVKKLVAEKIGEEHIIPTLGVYRNFDEIDMSRLPDQFVLKCTHDSGGVAICKDRSSFDWKTARTKLQRSLKHNYFWQGREWPYKNVPPRIIAEKYMLDSHDRELRDYKFYCFDGAVKAVMINSGRNTASGTRADYFDREFRHLDFKWGFEHADELPQKPERFQEMVEMAERLSKGLPEIRVDLYCCNGEIYFGEYTFFDGGGMTPFEPEAWDYQFGSYIRLPEEKK